MRFIGILLIFISTDLFGGFVLVEPHDHNITIVGRADFSKKSKKKNIVNETIKKDNDFAKVYLKSMKVSPKKLNIIISPIRGLIVEKALNYLHQEE